MRKTTELEAKGYKRKFVWWPVKLVCKERNVWIWWEHMLIKGRPYQDGWITYYLNLDGSEVGSTPESPRLLSATLLQNEKLRIGKDE